MPPIVKLLRIASLLTCTIVVVSFALFVVEQTASASTHQQDLLGGNSSSSGSGTQGAGTASGSHKSSVHQLLDEASAKLTSPFAGVLSTHSEWASRLAKLALALAVYGFGLGFLARVLRVRV